MRRQGWRQLLLGLAIALAAIGGWRLAESETVAGATLVGVGVIGLLVSYAWRHGFLIDALQAIADFLSQLSR